MSTGASKHPSVSEKDHTHKKNVGHHFIPWERQELPRTQLITLINYYVLFFHVLPNYLAPERPRYNFKTVKHMQGVDNIAWVGMQNLMKFWKN